MKKLVWIALATLVTGLVAAGCARTSCEKIEEACGGGDNAVEDCIDDYRDGNADCKKAIREFAKCVDDDGCEGDSCASEAMDVLDEC